MRYGRITEEELTAMQTRVSERRGGNTLISGRDKAAEAIRRTPTSGVRAKAGSNPASSPPFAPYRSKLEKKYSEHLDMLVKAGEIRRWEYEPILLKLADDARYRPDFLVVLPGGLERRPELHEVKGKWIKNRRDSLTHLKWAAQKYEDVFTFRLIEWNGHGFDGRYVVEP